MTTPQTVTIIFNKKSQSDVSVIFLNEAKELSVSKLEASQGMGLMKAHFFESGSNVSSRQPTAQPTLQQFTRENVFRSEFDLIDTFAEYLG